MGLFQKVAAPAHPTEMCTGCRLGSGGQSHRDPLAPRLESSLYLGWALALAPSFLGPEAAVISNVLALGSGPCKGLSTVTDVKKMLHYRDGVKCLQRKDATPPTFFCW